MRYLLVAAAVLGAAVLALLFPASGDTPLLSESFPLLLVVGTVIAVALLALVGWQLWQLRRRIRAGVFGSKLTLRLMLWFGLVALLPATIVFGASVFFLNRSIETWFDVRVDTALGSGVNLGQAALDDLLVDLSKKTERMALALSDAGPGSVITMLSALREQAAVNEATLFDDKGGVIVTAAGEKADLLPEIPERAILWQVLQEKAYSRVDDLPEKGLVMRVLVPVYSTSFAGETRVLQVLHAVPPSLARDAEAVQSAYRDYQEIAASRLGLKRMYGMALTLTLLLALLLTIALAYLLSDKMGAPLRTLARGTRAVAKGDFSQMQAVQSRDELGALIQSFNNMTRQLSEARGEAERNQLQTEQAKAYLESVLANLSSGVVALDHKLRVRAVNDAAARILEADGESLSGKPLVEWGEPGTPLRKFGEEAAERFIAAEGEDWNAQLEFRPGHVQILLARGSKLPAEVQRGYTLVFDDVTKLIRAERDAAWGEVARRLAHEIKNPLTPIQLSAERLSLRLQDKLAGSDAEMLARATGTIVNQVGAMKSMVDAFASYARMPSAQIAPLDLNALVREVLTLYDSAGVQPDLSADLPLASGDSTLMRQVIHNLLQNAQDALAGKPDGRVGIRTESAEESVKLIITDNGPGFPDHMMARMFEPYATTKPKGTGLGLPIVKKIVEELGGSIRVENQPGGGACVCVALPVYKGSTGGKQ
ncbi:HAMP domain-containing protein [Betaproteobacteria bacterium SCN2]|jgi:nitrogen fixation/metabolism regulation signal transduction histidine kinase|nr:HAMP domain-containing protein [Betaproteobacteria bacterium SCN2]